MTITGSAQVKMSEINTEFGRTSTTANTSLEDLSDGTVATINTGNDSGDRPDGSAPHAMSEFYSYDHDLVTNATFNAWTGSFSGNDITFSVTVGGSNQTKTGYGIFVTGSSGALLVGKKQVSGDTMDTTIQIAISTGGSSPAMARKIKIKTESFLKKNISSDDILQIKLQKFARLEAKQVLSTQLDRKKFLYAVMNDKHVKGLLKEGKYKIAQTQVKKILRELT